MRKSKHNRAVLIQALKLVPVFKMQNFSCKKKKKT